jgi:ribosome-associated protein
MSKIEPIQLRTGEVIPGSAVEMVTSRSGGPGGQHVNKVESKVEIRLDLSQDHGLSETTVLLLKRRLQNRITKEGVLHVTASSSRSQHQNRAEAIARLKEILDEALKPRKRRIRTRPTKASRRKRLEQKRQKSEKKSRRRWRPRD